MRKKIGLFLCVGMCCLAAAGQNTSDEIRRVLLSQQKAWNAGDIEGFMAFYWNSDSLTFQSGNNRLKGWQALLDRYRSRYAGDRMGELEFTEVEVNILNEESAYVLGRWNLARGDERLQGLFTIILKRFAEGWRIIHDHTSS